MSLFEILGFKNGGAFLEVGHRKYAVLKSSKLLEVFFLIS
jgi:hypothetical protein